MIQLRCGQLTPKILHWQISYSIFMIETLFETKIILTAIPKDYNQ